MKSNLIQPIDEFKELAQQVDCRDEIFELGQNMKDWLDAHVIDEGTKIDQGAGYGCFDLWATVGDQEVFITIQKSGKQKSKEAH